MAPKYLSLLQLILKVNLKELIILLVIYSKNTLTQDRPKIHVKQTELGIFTKNEFYSHS